jgi:RND family efflux transporter MFP subunit
MTTNPSGLRFCGGLLLLGSLLTIGDHPLSAEPPVGPALPTPGTPAAPVDKAPPAAKAPTTSPTPRSADTPAPAGPVRVESRKPVGDAPLIAPTAPMSPLAPIVVTGCWVQFHDHVTLASDRGGVIAFLEPDEGGRVEARQYVAGLDERIARAAYETAAHEAASDVEVRAARKAADVAQAEHQIALDANRRVAGAVPAAQVSRLKLAAEKAVLQIEQSEHAHHVAALKRNEAAALLQTHRLQSPFAGIVLKVFKRPGEAVRQGDPIVQIGGTARVKVEGFVNAADAWTIRPGAPVSVRLDLPDVDLPVEQQTFPGRLRFVDFAVQPLTRQVRVWAEVTNRDDLLRPGLTAALTILPEPPTAAGVAEGR